MKYATTLIRRQKPSAITAVMIASLTALVGVYAVFFSQAAVITTPVNDSAIGTATNQFEYGGAWTAASDPAAFGGDQHTTSAKDAYYQVRFNGTQAKIYTTTDVGNGLAAISIDGGAETTIDTYYETLTHGALIYTSSILANGPHTLKVRNTGEKSEAAAGTNLAADRVEITTSTISISIDSPAKDEVVTGVLPVGAKVLSSAQITKAEFYIDDALKATESSAPYCLAGGPATGPCNLWDSKTLTNGPHTLEVRAYDETGDKQTAKAAFTVSNSTTKDTATTMAATAGASPPAPVIPGWRLLWQDNFDGTTVNTTTTNTSPTIDPSLRKSAFHYFVSAGHSGNGLRRAEAFSVSGGKLIITAQTINGLTVSGGMANNTGSIYGRFDTRARVEADPTGTMSGLVMTWPDAQNNCLNGELDFFETQHLVNSRQPFKTFLHQPTANQDCNPTPQTAFNHNSDATQWHRTVMEWKKDSIRVRVWKSPDGAIETPDGNTDDERARLVSDDTLKEETDRTKSSFDAIPDVAHHNTIQLDAFKDNSQPLPPGVVIHEYVDYIRHYVLDSTNPPLPPPGDTTLPVVSMTAPTPNSTISGSIPVTANATDNVGVVGVQFQLDGTNLGAEDTTAPYATTWNATTASTGTHTLTAVGRDAAGNKTTATPVTITVSGTETVPPTVSWTMPAAGAAISGQLTEAAANCQVTATDASGIVKVEFFLDGTLVTTQTSSPYNCIVDTTKYANGTHTFGVKAYDKAGNSSDIVPRIVNFNNADTTKPIVSITSPTSGTTVAATVTITATASDLNGIVGVQFQHNGTNVGTEDTTNPYTYTIDTTTFLNGTEQNFTAIARDASGNSQTSPVVTITIQNPDSTPPSPPVSLDGSTTQPTETTPGKVDLNWRGATDNPNGSGLKGYYVYRDDKIISPLITTTTLNPADGSVSSAYADNNVPVGSHAYSVRSVDNAGLTSTTASPVYTTTITPPPDITPPTPPAGLAATTVSSSQINLSWTPSTDTGSAGLKGYNIYRNSSTVPLNATLVTTTTYGDGTVAAATPYTYRVEAVDGAGNKSAMSSSVSVTTPSALAANLVPFGTIPPAGGLPVVRGLVPVQAKPTSNSGISKVEFYLDNSLYRIELNSPYCMANNSSAACNSWNSAALPNGSTHTITAYIYDTAGRKSIASSERFIINNTPSVTTVIDDNLTAAGNNQFQYTGTWTLGSNSAHYGGADHYSNKAGNYALFTFYGTQAKIYGNKFGDHGFAGFSIDGGTEKTVDTYGAPNALQVLAYTSPVLSQGVHTVKIRVTGTKNARSAGTVVAIDKAEVVSYPPLTPGR